MQLRKLKAAHFQGIYIFKQPKERFHNSSCSDLILKEKEPSNWEFGA